MILKKVRLLSVGILAAALVPTSLIAAGVDTDILVENKDAPFDTAGTHDYGQSFLVPAGEEWNNLTVNFFATTGNPASTPFAAGTLFLLGSEYLGTQGSLSGATEGFIAQTSTINGGIWEFEPTITLAPDTQYWIYTKGDLITPIAFLNSNPYAGGIGYQDIGSGYTALDQVDFGFSIQGVSTPVPEPASALILGVGALGLVVFLRRRHS